MDEANAVCVQREKKRAAGARNEMHSLAPDSLIRLLLWPLTYELSDLLDSSLTPSPDTGPLQILCVIDHAALGIVYILAPFSEGLLGQGR